MANPQQEIDQLRAANKVLEEENAQLSERAEDAMLLGLVAEAIEGLTEPMAVIDQVLERISILKNLPFVTCGTLHHGVVEKIASYAAFSDEPEIGYPIRLSREVCRELSDGPFLSDDLQGISRPPVEVSFSPQAAILIPFHCHHYGAGVFIVFDNQTGGQRLASMLFLLDQVVRLAIGRLDNIFLARQLALLNLDLEKRVDLKTKHLSAANTRLQQVYERFVAVLDGVDSYVHVTDTRDFTILFANKTAKMLFGATIEGQKCHRVFRQEDLPCFFCKVPKLLTAAPEADQAVTWESFNPMAGKWFLNSERIVDWPEVSAALLTVGTDITLLKKAEEDKQILTQKLHQAQKMEAIGVLAGSIAHDLNNILSGIVSYPDLLLATMPPDTPLRKPLETIRSAGAKAAKIVQGLLSLSRRGIQVEEVVDLSLLIAEYLESPEYRDLLQHHEKVRVIILPVEENLLILGSPAHLSNVLMNLVNNAAEAIHEGGSITIGLDKVELSDRPPGFEAWRPGPYARLMVSDTGSGIPQEYQERIFEPFFSSKTTGRSGTGLGLAIVWGTVSDHHGYIEFSSNKDQGTRFIIYLPLAGDDKRREAPPAVASFQGQGQSILVVDDDEQQRQIASEILVHLGYKVQVVESGVAAICLLQQTPFDLVILDMLMPPGIDGLETYKRICDYYPGQKAIIVSGYSQSERVREALTSGALQYLQKPYALAKLSEAAHNALKG